MVAVVVFLFLFQALLVDPQLQESLPTATLGAMGVAVLMNLIETYVSPAATDESRALSVAGVPLVAENIHAAVEGT